MTLIRDINLSFLGFFFKFYIYIYYFNKSYIHKCVYIYILIYIEKIHFCKEREAPGEREGETGGRGRGRGEENQALMTGASPYISELHADVLTRYSSPASPSTPPPHPSPRLQKADSSL